MTRSVYDGGKNHAERTARSDRHRLLAAERRRTAIDVLEGRSASVDLADLAAAIAAREDGLDGAGEEAVDRVALSLHHVHLPMMDDLGVIDYDPDANRIESHLDRTDS